jgi:hypothetical protein
MTASHVLALLPTEMDRDTSANTLVDFLSRGATALVRDDSGRMTLESVSDDVAFLSQVMRTGCFRRGKAIIEPTTRQVIGYEMEMIAMEDEVA